MSRSEKQMTTVAGLVHLDDVLHPAVALLPVGSAPPAVPGQRAGPLLAGGLDHAVALVNGCDAVWTSGKSP